MTSLEQRRERRYQRRKAARLAKKRQKYGVNDSFETIASYRSLYDANRRSMRNVAWKASVQRYQMNFLRNIHDTNKALLAGKNITKGFVEFDTVERGKTRHIRSVHFSERVVQRSVCDNSLIPLLSRKLIYDNGACLKGKGIDWALDRLDAHLQQFYRANGFSNEGFILKFDFSGYFDCILHEICMKNITDVCEDERIIELVKSFIYPFGFEQVAGNWRKMKRDISQEKYTGKSLGLGSQVSQISAISYPNMLDHYIKQVLHVRWYGRYMDDGYLLFKHKKDAVHALKKICEVCNTLGITVNQKKTQIISLKRDFVYLKVRHRLTPSGKTIRRLSKVSITRQRRKFKKFYKMYLDGKMSLKDISQAYGSWKGYALRRNARLTVRNMDRLFASLFRVRPPRCKLQ